FGSQKINAVQIAAAEEGVVVNQTNISRQRDAGDGRVVGESAVRDCNHRLSVDFRRHHHIASGSIVAHDGSGYAIGVIKKTAPPWLSRCAGKGVAPPSGADQVIHRWRFAQENGVVGGGRIPLKVDTGKVKAGLKGILSESIDSGTHGDI